MLVSIEGIDGSGKGTQATLLYERLQDAGHRVTLLGFPRYDGTFFGGEVGRYLNGDFGPLDHVDPHFSALLYALDRFESRELVEDALRDGGILICDRYVDSNIAHQVSRLHSTGQGALESWIRHVEHSTLGLPRPDLSILLDMGVSLAQQLVQKKSAREYTTRKLDIQEASRTHLHLALEKFRALCASDENRWRRVNCLDESGGPRNQASILDEIYDLVVSRL